MSEILLFCLYFQVLSLELKDLEPEVTKEVEAARGLVEPRPQEVPPQLLTALEKDGRGLARSYEAARGVSDSILQGLQAHRDSYKVRNQKRCTVYILFF